MAESLASGGHRDIWLQNYDVIQNNDIYEVIADTFIESKVDFRNKIIIRND